MSLSWTADAYWLTRTVFQRALGAIYLIAFVNAVNQFKPLLGERGLLPVTAWVKAVPFRDTPSVFYLRAEGLGIHRGGVDGVTLSLSSSPGSPTATPAWLRRWCGRRCGCCTFRS